MNCEICGEKISGRGKTCNRITDKKTPTCFAIFMQQSTLNRYRNPDKKTEKTIYVSPRCPFCLLKYENSPAANHCGAWDCYIAERRCNQWGVSPEQYHREFQKREAEQRTINRRQPNALKFTEKISCV